MAQQQKSKFVGRYAVVTGAQKRHLASSPEGTAVREPSPIGSRRRVLALLRASTTSILTRKRVGVREDVARQDLSDAISRADARGCAGSCRKLSFRRVKVGFNCKLGCKWSGWRRQKGCRRSGSKRYQPSSPLLQPGRQRIPPLTACHRRQSQGGRRQP
jgi:hypothetical protein